MFGGQPMPDTTQIKRYMHVYILALKSISFKNKP